MRYDADHKSMHFWGRLAFLSLFPEGSEHQSIRFLQYVVTKRGNTDPAIHNYLLSLYAEGEDEFVIDCGFSSFLLARYPLLNFIRQKKVYFDLQYIIW